MIDFILTSLIVIGAVIAVAVVGTFLFGALVAWAAGRQRKNSHD